MLTTGTGPSVLIALDFTGDGAADIVTGNDGSTVSLLAGRGDGTFFNRVDHAVNFAPRSIVAGDFSGDGKPDVAIANGKRQGVSLLVNALP